MAEEEAMTETPEAPTQKEVEESAPDAPALTPDEGENGEESGDEGEGAGESDPATEDGAPAEASSYDVVEENYKALEAEVKKHTAKISTILGDDANELIICPFCEPELQGFLRPQSLDKPRDDIHHAMIEVLKKPKQVTYPPAPHTRRCTTCQGTTKVDSGSLDPKNMYITCPKCQGRGYELVDGTASNGHSDSAHVQVPALVGGDGPVFEETDVFGSPRLLADGMENPNYGKTLQYKDPQIESEYLRRLTGQ